MLAVTGGLGLLVVILIVLAASGIYAIMSFSVSERTREIGIRTALGAQRRSLVITVLRRSLTQIAVGALVGMPMAAWILIKFQQQSETGSAGMALGITLALGVTVVTVGALFSCGAPTRRLLSIGATTALRAEG
jgi:ABC-type antimicrobial peptide transport system permease subunit